MIKSKNRLDEQQQALERLQEGNRMEVDLIMNNLSAQLTAHDPQSPMAQMHHLLQLREKIESAVEGYSEHRATGKVSRKDVQTRFRLIGDGLPEELSELGRDIPDRIMESVDSRLKRVSLSR